MTTKEKQKCEKLLDEAILSITSAHDKFFEAEKHKKNKNNVNVEISLGIANNHRGYAEGIYQALVVLGYKSDKMRDLEGLI